MFSKRIINIAVFVILPILVYSLGDSMSSLTRLYVGSGSFGLSIFLGAFVTTNFYAQKIKKRLTRYTTIFILGVLVPVLYIISANEIYGLGWQEYSEIWSPIYFFTTLIGFVEIMFYIGIYFIFLASSIKSFFKKTSRVL